MQHQWSLQRGAMLVEGGVRFSVWAPSRESLAVRLFDGSASRDVPMRRGDDGVFEATLPGAGAGTLYGYVVDGEARPDPVSRSQPRGVHGPSCVVDPGAYGWADRAWRGLDMADLRIYELHVGTFTPEGTFDAVAERLGELRELGVNAIEIMPVAEFPGGRNWGYDGVSLYAPQSTYGGPAGLKRLVAAAHGAGLAVVLDVVYNHIGPEGNYLDAYGPYFTDRYKTPWGRALNFDDADSDGVRRYFLDNARYWVTEFHVDALRLDAVHAIYDFGAHHILQEIGEAVHDVGRRLGRRTLVIAESDLNDPRLLRAPACGGYGLDAQWSDDFHHAVHTALTGERQGYYADFGGVGDVVTALRDRYVYAGRRSEHRRRRHGAPGADVSADHFVVYVQNHDQVGNRARGDRLGALVPFEQLKLAAALLLLSPYVPMLFMGEEYGETNPFLYFVSHTDQALVQAVREGRTREFSAFAWQGEVPDPHAEETFRQSILDRAHRETLRGSGLLALHRELLRLRRDEPALRPGDAEVRVDGGEAEGWVTLRLTPRNGRRLLAVFNLSGEVRRVPLPEGGDAGWNGELSTEQPEYVGSAFCFQVEHPGKALDAARGASHVVVAAHAAELYSQETD